MASMYVKSKCFWFKFSIHNSLIYLTALQNHHISDITQPPAKPKLPNLCHARARGTCESTTEVQNVRATRCMLNDVLCIQTPGSQCSLRGNTPRLFFDSTSYDTVVAFSSLVLEGCWLGWYFLRVVPDERGERVRRV